MNNKRIIIILCIVVFILAVIVFSISIKKSSTSSSVTPSDNPSTAIDNIPTGIIPKPETIKNGDLDIVGISPKDQTTNLELDTPIEITFSRPLQANEVIFSIGPKILFEQKIQGNKLIIDPVENYNPGTLYTYSVDFPADKQKIRVYTFITTGTQQQELPDTSDKEFFEQQESTEKENYPDIYLTNRTPYETTTFQIVSTYVPQVPAHFRFTVTLKGDKEKAQKDFKLWLYTLELTDEKINTLDIIYK